MPQKQERFVRTEINFVLGKNGGYMPSSLGGRSIVVSRQAGRWVGGWAGGWVGGRAGRQEGRQANKILQLRNF